MIKLAIIILNKSNNKQLFECLSSIKAKTLFQNYWIYIGDTGSTDEELAEIRDFIGTNFAETQNAYLVNLGTYNFGKNNNEIVFKHLKHEETLLLFCNNDIKLIDDCITTGVQIYSMNHSTIGTIGFKLLFGDDTIQHAGQKLIMNQDKKFIQITHEGLRAEKSLFGNRGVVIGNTMALCLTQRELFTEIGGFNENYIECFEDVEYNLQCLLRHKHNAYVGDMTAYHLESQTRNRNGVNQKEMLTDARERLLPFIEKNITAIWNTNLVYVVSAP